MVHKVRFFFPLLFFFLLYLIVNPHYGFLQQKDQTPLTICPQNPESPPTHPNGGWVFSDSNPNQTICKLGTGEHILIPESPITRNFHDYITGFGFDPVSKSHKLIRISDDANYKFYYGTYLEVYNFQTGNWKVVNLSGFDRKPPTRVSSLMRFSRRPNTYLNGFLHWITYPFYGSMSLISFNLHTEEFRQVPMPPGLDLDPIESRPKSLFLGIGIPSDQRVFQHYLLVLGERLSLVHHVNDEHVEIWVMGEYGVESSWEKKYVIRNIVMDHAGDGGDIVKGPYKPIKLMENGEILVLCSDQNLGYYDPAAKVFRPFDNGGLLYRSLDSEAVAVSS